MRLEGLEPLFQFSIHLSVRKSRENIQTDIWKASLWGNLSTDTPPKFFSKILCFLASVYNFFFFLQKAVMRKLFDIRFSYKHCSFSRVCLLVKMASKTVTRSILLRGVRNSQNFHHGRDRSAWPVLKHNQAAKFLKNFQVHFVLFVNISS